MFDFWLSSDELVQVGAEVAKIKSDYRNVSHGSFNDLRGSVVRVFPDGNLHLQVPRSFPRAAGETDDGETEPQHLGIAVAALASGVAGASARRGGSGLVWSTPVLSARRASRVPSATASDGTAGTAGASAGCRH